MPFKVTFEDAIVVNNRLLLKTATPQSTLRIREIRDEASMSTTVKFRP